MTTSSPVEQYAITDFMTGGVFQQYTSEADALRTPRLVTKDVAAITLFAVVALDVLFWFPRGLPVGTGDGGLLAFYYHPSFLVHAFSSTWNPYNTTGLPAGQYVSQLPEAVFFALGRFTGLSYAIVQETFYWVIQFVAMLFMFRFLSRLLPRNSHGFIAALFGALLFNFSPAVIINYWSLDDLNLTIIAMIPVLLFLGLETPRRSLTWGVIAWSVAICVFSQVFWNPVFVAPLVACLAASLIIGVAREVTGPVRSLTKVAVSMACAAAANAWFLVPLLLGSRDILSSASTQESPATVLADANLNTSVWDLIRGVPLQKSSPAWDYKLPSWRLWYFDGPFRTLATILFLLMLVAVLVKATRRISLVFLTLWLLGILFALGSKGISGGAFLWAFDHIPYFVGFRNPGNDAVPLYLSGSVVLATLGFYCIVEYLGEQRSRAMVSGLSLAVVTILIVGQGWPLFTPNVLGGPVVIRGSAVSSSVDVPAAYDAMGQYVRSHGALSRTLVMPLAQSSYVTRLWGSGYDGINSSWQLLDAPTLSDLQSGSAPVTPAFQDIETNPLQIIKLAGTLNCTYVLVDPTIRVVGPGPRQAPSYGPQEVATDLTGIGATLVKTSGPLQLYQLPRSLVAPLVSVTGSGGTSAIPAHWVNGAELTAVLPASHQRRLLVFNESPNAGWRLAVNSPRHGDLESGLFSELGIGLLVHARSALPAFEVDNSKNGWVIPASASPRAVVIYFNEQAWLNVSLIISAETVVVVVVLVVVFGRRRRRRAPVGTRPQDVPELTW